MDNAIVIIVKHGGTKIRIEVPCYEAPNISIPFPIIAETITGVQTKLAEKKPEKQTMKSGELLHPDDSDPNNRGAMYVGGKIRRMMGLKPSIKYSDFVVAGISSSSFEHMRKNAARATKESIVKIAKVFGLTAEEFLEGKTISFPASPSGMPEKIVVKDEEEAPDPSPVVPEKEVKNVVPFAPPRKAANKGVGKGRGRGPSYDVSRQLSGLLKEKNMGPSAFAKSASMYAGDISNLRHGKTKAGPVAVTKLARAFGMTAEEFIAWPGKPGDVPIEEMTPIGAADPSEQSLKTTVLANWMEAKLKTATDIANAVGFDAPTIRRFANGSLGYGETMTKKFARVFNVTVEEFKAGPKKHHHYDPQFNGSAIQPFARGSKEGNAMAEGDEG